MGEDKTFYEDTKKNIKDWLKSSWEHFNVVKDSFLAETKKLVDEAREEFQKEQAKKQEKRRSNNSVPEKD